MRCFKGWDIVVLGRLLASAAIECCQGASSRGRQPHVCVCEHGTWIYLRPRRLGQHMVLRCVLDQCLLYCHLGGAQLLAHVCLDSFLGMRHPALSRNIKVT